VRKVAVNDQRDLPATSTTQHSTHGSLRMVFQLASSSLRHILYPNPRRVVTFGSCRHPASVLSHQQYSFLNFRLYFSSPIHGSLQLLKEREKGRIVNDHTDLKHPRFFASVHSLLIFRLSFFYNLYKSLPLAGRASEKGSE
jgi:hypothetical protein